jgi:hypothetical protein
MMRKRPKPTLVPLNMAPPGGDAPADLPRDERSAEQAAEDEHAADALFAPAEPQLHLGNSAIHLIGARDRSAPNAYRPVRDAAAAQAAPNPSDAAPIELLAQAETAPIPKLERGYRLESAKPPKPQKAKAPPAAGALPGWARSAYWVAVPAAVLWAGAMAAFASGYQNPFGPFEYRPFPMAAFAGLCLLPAVFILLSAYAVRQAAKLGAETRHARDLAGDMAIPVALAADQAAGAAETVRREIERAGAAAAAAEQQLIDLRRTLSEESDRLIEATDAAGRRAQDLTQGLARERAEMTDLTRNLDNQVQAVSDAIAAQSRMVLDTSDLAATQLHEAEAALAARAADLASVAGDAGQMATLAGQVLAEHAERLEIVGETVSARVGGLSEALADEQRRLAALTQALRDDQQHIADQLEGQHEQLRAASAEARVSADDLAHASARGAESLRALIASVAEQVGQLAATAEADQAALSESARQNLKLFTGVVAEERAALEAETHASLEALAAAAAETRKAALEQTEAARDHIQQLGEAAFSVGQKADQVFDSRMTSARRMIEQQAGMVEEAGQRSAERIESGLAATQGALQDLEKLLGDIDGKVAALPNDARARAETVREAVEQGIGDLTAAARRAAEETQAIDAVFQSRIKHNYEVLSEALRLMGQVADAAEVATKPAPAQRSEPRELRPAGTAPEPVINAAVPETGHSIRLATASLRPSMPAPAPPSGDLPQEPIGLRPRLKLTVQAPPAPSRPAVAPTQTATAAPSPLSADSRRRDGGDWTWKDLLSSIDEPPIDDEVLAERLIAEIEALGLDASALLPHARIDEIAAVMQSGDSDGARDVVRNLAPAAIRRLSRRVLTDKVLRAHADRYLQRYEDLLTDSAKRDRDGFITATLLGSDPGRAFLLFNAAVGELH